MYDKRGQITIFIIAGVTILLIIVVGGFIIPNLRSNEAEVEIQEQQTLLSSTQSVISYVNLCLKSVAEEGITKLGLQGGYINLPDNTFSTSTYNTSYLYFEGINQIPTINQIENELANFILDNIEGCVDFSIFKNIVIQSNLKETNVKVTRDKVIFNLEWPLTLSLEGINKQIKDFNVNLNLEFMDVYKTVHNIVKATENHPIIIDNLLLISQNVSFIDYVVKDDDKVIYLILENESESNQPYYFLFATKIVALESNFPPIIANISVLNAKVGIPFYFKINATDPEGSKVYFKIRSPLFEINNITGIINFTPTSFQRGEHLFPLYVRDEGGKITSTIVKLIIIAENKPPKIIVANKTIRVGEEFLYQPYVYDEDDYVIGIILIEGPNDMTIKDNIINWTPTNTGNNTVTIQASDGELKQQASFIIEVIQE